MAQPTKKTKIDYDDLANEAWEHYKAYLDSIDDEENPEGDVDYLVEILNLLKDNVPQDCPPVTQLRDKKSLLSILMSVSCYVLAEQAIDNYLNNNQQQEDCESEIQQYLAQCLTSCPYNAAAWSMGANFGRMNQCLSLQGTLAWYQKAVDCAVTIRQQAIEMLEDSTIDDSIKEWIELLLLNQMVGVELLDGESWSTSAVEATARFMAAMQLSMAGQHDKALQHLQQFDVTHRLHPNVWQGVVDDQSSSINGKQKTDSVALFENPHNGILPNDLYQRLCQVFAPNAAYWKESDYDNRGYYSYFMDYQKNQKPSNLIEHVIVHHLLPLVQQRLLQEETDAPDICGFEWWVHHRPIQANLGHNLHFDTDEALLRQQGKITHPIFSSVLYLTGDTSAGATIVLDQTPESDRVAPVGWKNTPKDNTFLIFPGNLLHGVLPCPGNTAGNGQASSSQEPNVSDLWNNKNTNTIKTDDDPPYRLTFMVGFWTRRVPDEMKEQRLYGPCGPLPPNTQEHSWVAEICQGYDKKSQVASSTEDNNVQIRTVPQVAPVWEEIQSLNDPPLDIPKAIDHRYFVHGAPTCFRDSLFEKDEFDEE